MNTTAVLVLADGSAFYGQAVGALGCTVGEVVFNTAMTGYQEILTDPSYAQQLITLTYPHIGNVGINEEDLESPRIYAAGLIIRAQTQSTSNWRAISPLVDYLQQQKCVAISGIDTRRLTRILRTKGAQHGCIMTFAADADLQVITAQALQKARAFPGLVGNDLAAEVSAPQSYSWTAPSLYGYTAPSNTNPSRFRVVAYDFGVKHSILRLLVDHGCQVTVVPAKTSAQTVLDQKPDGIFLSNGPGDPAACDYAITAIRTLQQSGKPIFGICLGHQLLALANGAQTYKMDFGHHGANHPVVCVQSGRVYISSQNHGFAVHESSLPKTLAVTHRSLFDGSIQGLRVENRPIFSFQGHPEAGPGPHDLIPLFQQFVDEMALHAQKN